MKKTEEKLNEIQEKEIKHRSKKNMWFKYSMSTYSAMVQIAVISRLPDKEYMYEYIYIYMCARVYVYIYIYVRVCISQFTDHNAISGEFSFLLPSFRASSRPSVRDMKYTCSSEDTRILVTFILRERQVNR